MKKVVATLVTSLAMVGVGVPTPGWSQDSAVDMHRQAWKTVATLRRMAAEVLAVNRGADALTVRSTANGKETDVIFSVQESSVARARHSRARGSGAGHLRTRQRPASSAADREDAGGGATAVGAQAIAGDS
mgnify:CR=1 FL=1